MRVPALVARSVLLLVGGLVLLASAPADGQTAPDGWTVPRTPDGHPDLQGVWANNTAIPLERPEAWAGRERLSEEELASLVAAASDAIDPGQDALFGDQLVLAAIERTQATSYDPTTGNYNQFWIVDRTFSDRTALVIDPPDGRVPPLTEQGQARAREARASAREHPADSYTDRPLQERCISYGMPNLLAGYNSYYHVAQNRDHVVVVQEMIHDARVIPLTGQPHLDESVRQLHGDSRGYWDGDTLVVETTNYTMKGLGRRPTTEALRVTERFTRVDPTTLHHEITFDDPGTWTKPWTMLVPLDYSPDPIFEYACHEGNIGMEGILGGHRAEETAASGAGSQPK